MWTAKFWKDATERAIKTASQALALILGAEVFNLLSMNVLETLATVATAALLSYATSLGSETLNPNESGSLLK